MSPERRNRRQDLTHFEEIVNRASLPRKSHNKNKELDDSERGTAKRNSR